MAGILKQLKRPRKKVSVKPLEISEHIEKMSQILVVRTAQMLYQLQFGQQ